ncbi:MAG TPA: hypothetical protein VNO81_11320 [Candidatus Nitrosotenuis sp.]|nr:hypothetical protein [Candidatus Nitrosotenuis sp.]
MVLTHANSDGKAGCLVEIRCQSKETLRNGTFAQFARDLCEHILASRPIWVSRTDIPWEKVREEERLIRADAEKRFATSDHINDFLQEKMNAWYQKVCLMEQPFYKDRSKVVGQVWQNLSEALDDYIEIRRLACFAVEGD